MWICCDLEYNLYLSKNKNDAIPISFTNNYLAYIKPKLRYDFDIINLNRSIPNLKLYPKNNGLKIGILLAGGLSSRFKESQNAGDMLPVKQLFKIDNKPIVWHSMNVLEKIMDCVIIVTNSSIHNDILELIVNRPKFRLVINDINCRLKSIETALIYIRENYDSVSSIIIHDSARPFITIEHLEELQKKYTEGLLL